MRTNPFRQRDAPAWLAEDPIQRIPRLLEHMLSLAEHVPDLYKTLPWLKEMDVWGLILERMSQATFPDEPPSEQEAMLMAFFANVTQPVAEMIESLYVSRLQLYYCPCSASYSFVGISPIYPNSIYPNTKSQRDDHCQFCKRTNRDTYKEQVCRQSDY